MNKENWIDLKIKTPKYGRKVNIKLDNGQETIGLINNNEQRTCWLIKGVGGKYWRSLVNTVTHWKPIKESETC